jgi:para-aminobenzoate synthetase component 1
MKTSPHGASSHWANHPPEFAVNQAPSFALRIATKQGLRWALGTSLLEQWTSGSSEDLLQGHLDQALSRLASCNGGLLVGLLPYPAPSGGQTPYPNPPACLLLSDSHAISDRLPHLLPTDFRMTAPFAADCSREQYIAAVHRVKEYLTSGDAYQVNLSQRFTGSYTGSPWNAFVRLANHFDPPHAAWLVAGDFSVISLSPELFLRGSNGFVETHPIKGTRPRHPDAGEDRRLADELALHPKDRAENLMIVDLLRNDLGRVCGTGSIAAPDLFRIESQRNVHHLVSTVTGRLRSDATLKDLLLACFPGGSVTGAPKVRAMEIIEELEPHARSVYCGTVFWVTADGHFSSNILIRTFLAGNGVIHGWAGAGIVADSVPESEYTECLDKLRPLMRFLENGN